MVTVSEAIRERWGDVDITLNCPEECEGWFSWSECDACGSPLGGERHPAVAWTTPNTYNVTKQTECAVCVDCLMLLANGVDAEVSA